MSRGTSLLVRTSFCAIALLAIGVKLRADDPPVPTPPPGSKLVYENVGGRKVPLFVKDQLDPIQHAKMGADPLDHQKVFSETNPMANKSFMSGDGTAWNKVSSIDNQNAFVTKVYNAPETSSVYNVGTKSTFRTSAYNGTHPASVYDKNFATKSADTTASDDAAAAFAAIGSSDQNRTAPIDAKPVDTPEDPLGHKTFFDDQPKNTHHNLGEIGDGTALTDLPNRPLSIGEVKNLINHGFKPDLTRPATDANRPLNDPGYQPEPLRIEPTESEAPPVNNPRATDDDKDDPVPSPGMMAEPPPENSQPLPSK